MNIFRSLVLGVILLPALLMAENLKIENAVRGGQDGRGHPHERDAMGTFTKC